MWKRFRRQEPSPARSVLPSSLVPITAPARLSLRDDPDPATAFFAVLEDYRRRGQGVALDMRPVEQLTPETCAMLAAVMEMFRRKKLIVRGTSPRAEAARALLVRSGFFEHVTPMVPPAPVRGDLGQIRRRRNDEGLADPTLVDTFVNFASSRSISRPEHKPSYRCLLECMANTRNHATEQFGGRQPWWVAVHFDPETNISAFSFLDFGVGILKSANIRMARKLWLKLGIATPADLLREVLTGEIPSRTELPYRGRGLPGMVKTCRSGQVRRLVVVANDAHADVEPGVYRKLKKPLHGTLVYWELHPREN
ncbi:MAG: hypothetical protein IT379_39310 [Deltaproteobacteria bacterium]|nr:hypothetical protein [Deltaproteobacteria bacterium]